MQRLSSGLTRDEWVRAGKASLMAFSVFTTAIIAFAVVASEAQVFGAAIYVFVVGFVAVVVSAVFYVLGKPAVYCYGTLFIGTATGLGAVVACAVAVYIL